MDKLIDNFSIKAVADFFATKISSFSPKTENLDGLLSDLTTIEKLSNLEKFSNLQKIGEVEFN
ncbi:hypothetical protein, partial [Enterobacter roggenkampii]